MVSAKLTPVFVGQTDPQLWLGALQCLRISWTVGSFRLALAGGSWAFYHMAS